MLCWLINNLKKEKNNFLNYKYFLKFCYFALQKIKKTKFKYKFFIKIL